MTFKVDTSGAQQSSGNTNTDKPKVDYDAMNLEVINTVGTQNKAKTVIGYPTGYVDLGMQPRANYEELMQEGDTPKAVKQREDIANGLAESVTKDFYDNGTWHKQADVFSKPRKPAKAFTLAVDFPQYEVDKGKYFGESNPQPLRLYMGGEWSVIDPEGDGEKKMRIVQNHMYMSENTNNPHNEWALPTTSTIHKMCVAANLENGKGLCSKDNITDVLGKPMMFNIQVFNKPAKNDATKLFYQEKIKFVSEVPEGMPCPELPEGMIHGVNFNQINDPDMLNQIRFHAKNTMKLATDYEGSVIKGEIDKAKEDYKNSLPKQDNTPVNEPKEPAIDGSASNPSQPDVDFDDDIPF